MANLRPRALATWLLIRKLCIGILVDLLLCVENLEKAKDLVDIESTKWDRWRQIDYVTETLSHLEVGEGVKNFIFN